MNCLICEANFNEFLGGCKNPQVCGNCCVRFLSSKAGKNTFSMLKNVSKLGFDRWSAIYQEVYG